MPIPRAGDRSVHGMLERHHHLTREEMLIVEGLLHIAGWPRRDVVGLELLDGFGHRAAGRPLPVRASISWRWMRWFTHPRSPSSEPSETPQYGFKRRRLAAIRERDVVSNARFSLQGAVDCSTN